MAVKQHSFKFRGTTLSTYMFGVLNGVVLFAAAATIVRFFTDDQLFVAASVTRMFIIEVTVAALGILITAFAVIMTIRSQLRQRSVVREIDRLYEKTAALSKNQSRS